MKKTIVGLLLLIVVLLGIGVCLLLRRSDDKIVYADAIRLFNSYKYKTDLEKESQGALYKLKAQLDSVGVIYKVNPDNPSVQQMVMDKQLQLKQAYDAMNKEINEKVWERLNPQIQAFGKDHNIEMMIGANGMGTLLYGSNKRDITDELVKYINERYEQGN